MEDYRVVIMAEDPLARAGLATLLDEQPGWQVSGRLAGDAALTEDLDLYQPDVLLWDAGWELDEADIDLLCGELLDLTEADPALPVVVLLPDPEGASAVWHAGARALLTRDVPADRLTAALTSALTGLISLDPALTTGLFTIPASTPDEDGDHYDDLTPRELEVLNLIAEGQSNRAIAYSLNISAHTVKFHVNSILTKLNAGSRTEAVVRATRLGLILL